MERGGGGILSSRHDSIIAEKEPGTEFADKQIPPPSVPKGCKLFFGGGDFRERDGSSSQAFLLG